MLTGWWTSIRQYDILNRLEEPTGSQEFVFFNLAASSQGLLSILAVLFFFFCNCVSRASIPSWSRSMQVR